MELFVGILIVVLIIIVLRHVARTKQDAADKEAFVARCAAAETQLEAGLPTIDVPISLQRGEVCHWAGPCSWYEMRTRTRRVTYGGVTSSVKLFGNVRYRVGSISPTYERESNLTEIDSGQLYITSKRIFFDGRQKNTSITHAKIAKISLMIDAVMVDKETGKDPYLKVGREAAPLVAGILARAGGDRE